MEFECLFQQIEMLGPDIRVSFNFSNFLQSNVTKIVSSNLQDIILR